MSMRGVGFMNLMSLDHTYFNVAIVHISFINEMSSSLSLMQYPINTNS